MFYEAGGAVPDRNVERLLRDMNVPVSLDDLRRLDLVVPGLKVQRGLPLFCDATTVIPLPADGVLRGGTRNQGGSLLDRAERENNETHAEVSESGLGSLQCLGCEDFGCWSRQSVELVPALARERARGMHLRIRRGTALSLQHRWWGVLGVALQKAVAHLVLNQTVGVDLVPTQLEPMPPISEVLF